MQFNSFEPDKSLSLLVKNIMVFEEAATDQKTVLPFFADGYPGLMYQQTVNGLLVSPHNKQMPVFFLYGETIKPIELVIDGNYSLIVFQLYPFVLKSFFGVMPKEINDGCYNLQDVNNEDLQSAFKQMETNITTNARIKIISDCLVKEFQKKKELLDFKIRQAIQFILDQKGQLTVSTLSAHLKITERTLERRFLNVTGLSPKQFSRIIQFQLSLEQLTVKEYTKLTDIGYENGFADHSHFIKVFKAFTGKTPLSFKKTSA